MDRRSISLTYDEDVAAEYDRIRSLEAKLDKVLGLLQLIREEGLRGNVLHQIRRDLAQIRMDTYGSLDHGEDQD